MLDRGSAVEHQPIKLFSHLSLVSKEIVHLFKEFQKYLFNIIPSFI